MGTTTEPPWVHKSSGVAPRNGTTAHTINFTTDGDAPFTPANGNLLVFVIFGAVTHTEASGTWTKRLGPVNSAELGLFEKSASSTTGVTINHNGSNYLTPWVVYEFPAGSAWTGGIGSTPSADTFPALTGLPGTEQVIIAGRGRSQTSTNSNQAASSTWGGSFVEDCDVANANLSGNEGTYLTVGHQINVTATSITPAATTGWVIDASWAPDREHIVAAYNVAAASSTTPVTGSVDLRWQVRSTVTGSADLRWQVRTLVAGSTDLRWSVANQVTGSTDLRWQVRAIVTGSTSLQWAVRNAVTGSVDARWAVRSTVAGSLDARWAVLNSVTASLDARWQVRAEALGTIDLRWTVLSTSPFTSSVSDDFNDGVIDTGLWAGNYGSGLTETGGRARLPCDTDYRAFQTATIYKLDSVAVQVYPPALNGGTANVGAGISIHSAAQPGGTDVAMFVDMVSGQVNCAARSGYFDGGAVQFPYDSTAHRWWRVRLNGTDLLWETSPTGSVWTVQRTSAAPAYLLTADDVSFAMETHRDDGSANFAEFDNFNLVPALSQVTSTLDARWAVKGVVTGTLNARWAVSNQITASLDVRWQSRQRATGTVELRWIVDGEVFIPRSDVRAYLSERVRSRPTLAQIRAYL